MTFFLHLLGWFIGLLSWPLRRALAGALASLLALLQVRAKIIDANLALAFPQETPEKLRLRRRLAYQHLGRLTLEVLMLFGPMPRYVRTRVTLEGIEHWKAAKARGKGVLFLASHVGNWEIMSAGGAILGHIDLMLVTKHLKPEWLHRAFEKARLRCGVAATYEPKTLRDVLRQLKGNATVGFVLDQYAGPPIGVRVPFFGTPVGTSTALAMLARRTGAAVLPVVNYRTEDGRFHIEIRPELSLEAHEDAHYELAANTARYAEAIERDIYAHPEQWLWTHRRFKGDLSPLASGEWGLSRPRPRLS